MFEYIKETDNSNVKLNIEQKLKVAQHIGELFSDWDNVRSKQKNIADLLRPEIYLDERKPIYKDKDDDWKSDIHLNKIYSLFQTQQAFIWENIYSDVENLFDVQGVDEVSVRTANLQKEKLVNTFYKIGLQRKLDMAVEHLGSVGEMCLFISWSKKYKQVRRPMDLIKQNFGLPILRQGAFGIFNQEIYNGANVEAINPLNLVFDPRVNPEDTAKWDACGKIIKSWETYDSIASNQLFKLSAEELADIKFMLSSPNNDKDKSETQKIDDIIDNDRIEVLQYWGDYTTLNGKLLKNWHIVVIARKYVAVFEHNRWIINPIINMALFRDVESKRGIPELWSIYDLCKEQENKVNLQNDAQALNLNPPAYAPEGFFKENKVKLFPGKQVEYKQGLEDPSAIIKMNFPLFSNENIIQYYDSTASNVSGIFPNMQGQQEAHRATATEINVKVQGQTTRLAKTLDTIKQNVIVPMVSKVAELEANMKFGDETVLVNVFGQKMLKRVGDIVRQGNYEYKYTDNSGIQRKLMQNQTLTQILTPVWNDAAVALNKPEIVKEALNNAGFENTDKYFINPPAGKFPFPAQSNMPANMGNMA
ncbi:MAG: hypothetical protein E7016_04015 [Alphaproteobacteria bacterium]|nr:hypothetical protein [Alphaproteobacteria bacterium]